MKRNGTERNYDVNGLDRCLVSFVPASFIGSSGGGIAQVVHRSAVEQVVTLTAGVTVYVWLEGKTMREPPFLGQLCNGKKALTLTN